MRPTSENPEPAARAIDETLELAQRTLQRAVDDAGPLFGEDNAAFISASWPEANQDLERLRAYVRVTSDDQFERVGLGVGQAAGKLALVRRMAGSFIRAISEHDWRVGRKLFNGFAKALNSLLGSVLKELPMVGEIAKEFKEHLENAAEEQISKEEDADVRAALDRPALEGDDGF